MVVMAPVLWIWDKDDNLLYEGAFSGEIQVTGRAYRYKHLCSDGIKKGLVLTQAQIDGAIVLDNVDFEEQGTIEVRVVK